MDGIHVDDSRWPLVIVRFRGAITDAAFHDYLRLLERNIERCEKAGLRTAILFDAEQGGASNAAQRKAQADWIKKHFDRSARWCAGYAFAIPSSLVRGMLQAILWFSPMPSPHVVVKTQADAEEWLLEQLQKANGRAPIAAGRLG